MLAWLSVWSEVQTCIWPSWCHCLSLSLASVKSRLVLPFWYRLTWVVPDKGPSNVCVYARACARVLCWFLYVCQFRRWGQRHYVFVLSICRAYVCPCVFIYVHVCISAAPAWRYSPSGLPLTSSWIFCHFCLRRCTRSTAVCIYRDNQDSTDSFADPTLLENLHVNHVSFDCRIVLNLTAGVKCKDSHMVSWCYCCLSVSCLFKI